MISSITNNTKGQKIETEEVLLIKRNFMNQFSLGYLFILGMTALIIVTFSTVIMKKKK